MKLYFAPLEGITKYVYRNTHSTLFSGCDGYFAPFINPSDQEKISKKEIVAAVIAFGATALMEN